LRCLKMLRGALSVSTMEGLEVLSPTILSFELISPAPSYMDCCWLGFERWRKQLL
jgi:hypothetical protein